MKKARQRKKMKTIRLTEIHIPKAFVNTPPNPEKLKAKKAYIQQHGKPEQSIIVHPDTQELVDGLASYLALKELSCTTVEVELGTKKHPQPVRKKKSSMKFRQSRPKIGPTKEAELEVWEAEDGRCEIKVWPDFAEPIQESSSLMPITCTWCAWIAREGSLICLIK